MPKLTDLQAILLSAAAQRESGSIFPAPKATKAGTDDVAKAIALLIRHSFAEERETDVRAYVHRANGDTRFGAYITDPGRAAIGVEPVSDSASAGTSPLPAPPASVTDKPARPSKSAAVVSLLQRDGGATLPELIAETGWLPHTTRAALTGLRKKGHLIDRTKRGDATCYCIVAAA